LAAARLLVSASATISFSSLPCLRDCRYTKNLCARQPDYPLLKMSGKTPVLTEKAPKPLPGIYSQAIKAGGMVYCSGAVPMDAQTMKLIDGDVKAHTHQCIKNLSAILEAAGTSIDKVVKVNVFLADMGDFAAMNEVYTQYWGDVKPCRTCVAVKTLPLNTDVEIECIALQ